MIGFILGIIYGSFMEWWVHKVLFHKYGRKKDSIFAYHLRDHHKVSLKNDYVDDRFSYRELYGILFLILIHLPTCLLSVDFFIGITAYAIAFNILHSYSHANPQWAKKYQPWHWRHHMQNPNKNWNVVLPIADKIMRTDK